MDRLCTLEGTVQPLFPLGVVIMLIGATINLAGVENPSLGGHPSSITTTSAGSSDSSSKW